MVSETHADLRDYYENEAKLRRRRSPSGRRVDLRDEFLGLLGEEGRTSLLDFGAGPGGDGTAFRAAGLRYLGVDLAYGNARLAFETGLVVIQGSVAALPIRSCSFDAGWSLSTLMHLDQVDAALAVDEMVRTLRPGAPLLVGVWGRETEAVIISDADIPGRRRPFHLRSFEENQRRLTIRADLEQAERWEAASQDWDYQVFHLRTGK